MTNVPATQSKKKNGEPVQNRGRSMQAYNLQDMEKVRAELNLEKWSIWQPASRSKTQTKKKIIQREITLPNGNKITAKVEIDFTSRGVLTTEDQKVFYGFIKLWEEAEKKIEPTFYSLRHLDI